MSTSLIPSFQRTGEILSIFENPCGKAGFFQREYAPCKSSLLPASDRELKISGLMQSIFLIA